MVDSLKQSYTYGIVWGHKHMHIEKSLIMANMTPVSDMGIIGDVSTTEN
jgi:hypothetical protein